MPKKTKAIPDDRAEWTFGDALYWHFFVYGTRPEGDPIAPAGRIWDPKLAAYACNVTIRAFWNWIDDRHFPHNTIRIEKALFQDYPVHDPARRELRRLLNEARQRQAQAASPVSGKVPAVITAQAVTVYTTPFEAVEVDGPLTEADLRSLALPPPENFGKTLLKPFRRRPARPLVPSEPQPRPSAFRRAARRGVVALIVLGSLAGTYGVKRLIDDFKGPEVAIAPPPKTEQPKQALAPTPPPNKAEPPVRRDAPSQPAPAPTQVEKPPAPALAPAPAPSSPRAEQPLTSLQPSSPTPVSVPPPQTPPPAVRQPDTGLPDTDERPPSVERRREVEAKLRARFPALPIKHFSEISANLRSNQNFIGAVNHYRAPLLEFVLEFSLRSKIYDHPVPLVIACSRFGKNHWFLEGAALKEFDGLQMTADLEMSDSRFAPTIIGFWKGSRVMVIEDTSPKPSEIVIVLPRPFPATGVGPKDRIEVENDDLLQERQRFCFSQKAWAQE